MRPTREAFDGKLAQFGIDTADEVLARARGAK